MADALDPARALGDVRAAAERIKGRVLRTPSLVSDALSRAFGATVILKLENFQPTGSFKERGAANRMALLSADERRNGVVTVSAGNHAQAVARHASLLGIDAAIVMPVTTPVTKVTRTQGWGAKVILHGETLAEANELANQLAASEGRVFVHPYDDAAVVAGQGSMTLEMLEDHPEIEVLLMPVGGGGLLAGAALVAAALKPAVEVYGVEVAGYAPMAQRLAGRPVAVGGPTIAEGIAVRDIGEYPFSVAQQLVREVLVVSERAIEESVALLVESAKLVGEGAGVAGLAALLSHREKFHGKVIGIPISGGNIDARILANVLMRNLLRDGRLLRLRLEIPDRPGVLADIATKIGSQGGNIIEVSHQRLFGSPSVQAAMLEVMVEARDPQHAAEITNCLADSYMVSRA